MRKPIEGQMRDIYEFIRDYVAQNGESPLRDELKSRFKISQVTLARHLEVLEFRKYIKIAKSSARGITINE